MKTCQLSPNIQAPPTTVARSVEAVLVGEIAERLIEWRDECGQHRPATWLMRLSSLAADQEATDAWVLYLRLSTGDLGQITKSFSEQGAERARTKQAEQQEQERCLRVIGRHFPELRRCIEEMLHAHKQAADPKE